MDTSTLKPASVSIAQLAQAPAPNPQDDLQKKILEILNKKPLVQQPKKLPMSEAEKEDLKKKLLQDDKVKLAMMALRNSKKKMPR